MRSATAGRLCVFAISVFASAASGSASAQPADAQPADTQPADAQPSDASPGPARVLSLTVSGGVSLGSFEAGVLHFLSESIKRSEGEVELRIATGASAGSANALISLIDSCSTREDDPTHSLGFRTWVPVGLKQLFDKQRVTATSVLTRAPLEAAMARVGQRYRAGLRSDCDVVLGVSVTRMIPKLTALSKQKLGPAVQVPSSTEKFVVRITGRGPGRVPLLRNYVEPSARQARPLLPLSNAPDDAAQARNFDQLIQLLFASASVPIAFAPVELTHCETDLTAAARGGDPMACRDPVTEAFIDGGVFDNSPLRLNYRTVQRNLRVTADGQVRWLDPGEPRTGQPPAVRFSYIDPSTAAFPALDIELKTDTKPSALDLAADLARAFIETARHRELLALQEDTLEARDLDEQMGLTQNQLPTISSQLGAFFGFFERDFRVLDFYLGMYDGLVSVRHFLEGRMPVADVPARMAAQFPVLERPLRPDLPAGQRPFACLLSQVEPAYAGHAAACDDPALRNFRILLQVTLDRLHAACSRSKRADLPPQTSPLCFAAASGAPRVHVRGVPPIDKTRCTRSHDERDFGYALRLLSEYRFEYRDLGLRPDQAEHGLVKIRRRLLEMADTLADKQPTALSKTLIAIAGRAGADQIAYEPPRNWLYVTAGTAIEVGASLLPFSWNQSWARINFALQVSSWDSIATPRHLTLAVTPLVGPELELLFMSTPTLQWMLGSRVGWRAAWTDGAGFARCDAVRAFADARNCSQVVLQAYLAAAPIERLRGQLVFEIFPSSKPAPFKSRLGLQLSFGLQFF